MIVFDFLVNIWTVFVVAVHDGMALLLEAFAWVPNPIDAVIEADDDLMEYLIIGRR